MCAAAPPVTHVIVIQAVAYQPATVVVRRGDRVKWINKDPFPHTVTVPGVLDSHSIAAGASWTYVARKSGTLDYACTLHPNMKGELQVQ